MEEDYDRLKSQLVIPGVRYGPEHPTLPENVEQLKPLGVTAVLTVIKNTKVSVAEHGIAHHVVEISDCGTEPITPHLEEAFAFVDRQRAEGGVVLIHCASGISRSGAAVIAYVMHSEGLSLAEAYALVHSKRPVVSPGNLFFSELQELEARLKPGIGSPLMTLEDKKPYDLHGTVGMSNNKSLDECRAIVESCGGDMDAAGMAVFGM